MELQPRTYRIYVVVIGIAMLVGAGFLINAYPRDAIGQVSYPGTVPVSNQGSTQIGTGTGLGAVVLPSGNGSTAAYDVRYEARPVQQLIAMGVDHSAIGSAIFKQQ